MPIFASVSASRSLQARVVTQTREGRFRAKYAPPSAPFRSPGMVLQRRIHRLPRQPVLKPDLATWRKEIRIVEGCARYLDLRGSVVRFVTDRRPAHRAERAGDGGRRAKTAKVLRPLQELEITAIEDGPRRRRRACREPATAAMTPTQGQRRSADAEPYGAAKTTTFVDVRRGGHLNAAAGRVDERTMLTRCERVRAHQMRAL